MTKVLSEAFGFIRGGIPRYPPEGQLKAMNAHSIPHVIQQGGKTLKDVPHVMRAHRVEFVRMSWRGRLLAVQYLFLLADPKAQGKKGGKRKDLWDTIRAIEAKDAILWELSTGRRTDDLKQRDTMIEDAIEALAKGRHKTGPHDRRQGRPKKEFPAEVFAHNQPIWENRHLKTWQECEDRFIGKMTAADAWKLWGPRK